MCVQGFDHTSGVPYGYRPPGSWMIPLSPGALSSYTTITGEGVFGSDPNLAGGKNATATLAGSGEISNALAALIVSAIATLTGSGSLTANLNAELQAVATLAGSGNLTATRTALGNIVATLPGVGTVTTTVRATGALEADITPFTDLSPQSLAAAVWASEQGRFLYAVGRNKVVTDPSTGTYTVYDDDDVTVLYTGDLWQDAAGTTPYTGDGAERRDRLT